MVPPKRPTEPNYQAKQSLKYLNTGTPLTFQPLILHRIYYATRMRNGDFPDTSLTLQKGPKFS